jgi:AraC-like DNA-binding protein
MLYPSFDLIRPIVTDIFGDDVMPTFHSPRVTDAGLAQALLSLHGLSGRSEADPLEIDSLLLLIIRHAFERHAGRRAEPGRRTDQASAIRMRDLLESEFSKPIALAALADVVGLSRFQALRQFKSTFGLPPHAFLRQIRVRRAQQLILSGEGLAVAAASVGFADQAHMTRIFRQTLGYTPGALARG